VSRPRFSIGSLMPVVLLAALDLLAIRIVLGGGSSAGHASPTAELLSVGVPPMASLLSLGLLALFGGPGRRGSRPALIGFEVFGWAAVLSFAVSALRAPRSFFGLVDPVLEPVRQSLGRDSPLFIPAVLSVAMTLLTLPQLAFALLGGWLLSGYRIRLVVERRRPADPESESSSPEGCSGEASP
jgi:hypothetical protein